MKNIKLLLLFFMSICFLSSCVMHKPMGDIGAPDYNKRQLITKASYSKRATKLGIGITVGTTVAGGVVGAVTQPVKLNTSEGAAKPVPAANAAVGAAIGYGITSFINHIILKQGRNGIPIDHQNNWIRKKYGNDKIFLRNENKGFWIVDRSIEDNFIVKNMQDVNDFFSAFPDAILYNKDRVIAQAIKEVDRSDLPTLLVLVPQTNHKQDLQEKYLSLSKNLEDLYEAIDRFPSLKSNAEQSIVAKTSNVTEAVKFARIYPNSIYNKQIIIKIFDEKSTVSEVKRIKGLYPNDFFITESDLKKLTAHNSDKEGYFHALYLYKDITTKSGLLKLADEYNWLNFTNKGSSILSYYWDIQYPNFSDGNRLVAATYYFSNDEGKNMEQLVQWQKK